MAKNGLTGLVEEVVAMLEDRLKTLLVVLPAGSPISHPDAHVQDDDIRHSVQLG